MLTRPSKNTQKPNCKTEVRTVHITVHIIIHNCVTQYSTEQFW